MSILYCCISDFAPALVRRDDPRLQRRPLVLIDPEERVFAASAEAAACGVVVGQTARAAEVRCPEAHLMETDLARCRSEFETLLQLLEHTSPRVEPHGWGAAYIDLGNLVQRHADGVSLCQEVGRAVRRELGEPLQPALGWDRTKFTAQAATKCTQPGHLRAVDSVRERAFLQPLPVTLLPLGIDALQRLGFLGLRTLGQYAALPPGAVWQQFGRAGRLAQRCARGQNDRPVVPRWQERRLVAHCDLDWFYGIQGGGGKAFWLKAGFQVADTLFKRPWEPDAEAKSIIEAQMEEQGLVERDLWTWYKMVCEVC